jgi:hypothetical protein
MTTEREALQTEGERMTMDAFIAKHGITMIAERAASNPNMADDPKFPMFHWLCTLKMGERTMPVSYSMGAAHIEVAKRSITGVPIGPWRKPTFEEQRMLDHPKTLHEQQTKGGLAVRATAPEVGDVLNSLSLDASALDQSFDDWCGDFGYDTDSRKAERTYTACRDLAYKLQRLLGNAAFQELRNDVEPL